jgi:hypothetical protein
MGYHWRLDRAAQAEVADAECEVETCSGHPRAAKKEGGRTIGRVKHDGEGNWGKLVASDTGGPVM